MYNDFYTQTYVDANYYDKSQTNILVTSINNDLLLQVRGTTYTRLQVDDLISGYIDLSSVYDKNYIDANYYDKSQTNILVASINNDLLLQVRGTTYTRLEVDDLISSDVDLSGVYDKIYIDNNYYNIIDIEANYFDQHNLNVKFHNMSQAFYGKIYMDANFYNITQIQANYFDQHN
jgi:hypothetical protein